MRSLYLIALVLFVVGSVQAQQEAQYTQFMYNKLSLNPAYAGAAEMPCFSCIHRSQWIGFEGAPTSQVINFHTPAFGKRVGFGASLAHDQIGPTHSYTGSLMYAYRIKLNKGHLALGMRGTLRAYQVNWSELNSTHQGDEEIPTMRTTRILPNFGFGVYYHSSKFYIGLSTPALLQGDLSYSHLTNNTDFGKEQSHLYLMGGYLLNLSKNLKFKPAALLKYTKNTPFDMDLNATFIFFDKFWAGLSYRLGGDANNGGGESIDLLVQYQLTPALRAGLSYDYSLSKLQNHQSGSVEVQVEYCLHPKDKRLTNPRFF